MTGTLKIYHNNELVNSFDFDNEQARSELIKILIADKVRNVKTTYKPKPYSKDIKIIEKWDFRDTQGYVLKYVYDFQDVDY